MEITKTMSIRCTQTAKLSRSQFNRCHYITAALVTVNYELTVYTKRLIYKENATACAFLSTDKEFNQSVKQMNGAHFTLGIC